ncbi:MAG: adenylyltransferase/cytidyltransferase family protein, partial [bacterium]|nr:adenylyltransferase/cytidyltransferase family protein [bacterium]
MANLSTSKRVKQIISGDLGFEHRYVPNYADLASTVRTLKNAGYRIVLTQGVYDLFHVGHKRYLEDAKKQGDILIVGVDTDELTKIRKGPKRPFDKLEDRVEILSGLKAVDIITIRTEKDHIYKLIKLVQPHILVMSETTEDFTERDKKNLLHYCGDIKVLPAKAGTSTTAKLRRLMIDGVSDLGLKVKAII